MSNSILNIVFKIHLPATPLILHFVLYQNPMKSNEIRVPILTLPLTSPHHQERGFGQKFQIQTQYEKLHSFFGLFLRYKATLVPNIHSLHCWT